MPTSPIYAYFSSLLALSLDTTQSSLIAGAVNEDELFVNFQGKNHVDYPTATITFKRSDGTISPELLMIQTSFVYSGTKFPVGTYANSYRFVFYDDWILALKGPLEATVRLYGQNGNVLVSGKMTLSVQPSVFSPETTITPQQYSNLVSQINSLANNDTAAKLISAVRNDEAVNLKVGQMIYVSGSVGSSGLLEVKKASNLGETTSSKTFGMVATAMNTTNAKDGYVYIYGLLTGINLNDVDVSESVFVVGDVGAALWLGENGKITKTIPTADNKHSVFIGYLDSFAGNGSNCSIYVKVQNGYELGELHDVRVSAIADNHILRYNSTRGVWENTAELTTAESNITSLQNLKANLASPALTGIPTAPTAAANVNNTQIATTAFVGTAIGDLTNYTDIELDGKVSKTQTIIGIDLQDNISLVEFKIALGNATQSLAGLMSPSDKTSLDILVALLNTGDGDNVVDTISEILQIFEQYPEGADLVTALNGKVDKIVGKGLSENDYTTAEVNKVSTAYAHVSATNNPHSVTKAQVGLGNVDNTSDANKPVSTATQTALDLKLNKVSSDELKLISATLPTNTTGVSSSPKTIYSSSTVYNFPSRFKTMTNTLQSATFPFNINSTTRGLFFSPDGTKAYLADTGAYIFQFTFATPWDLSTINTLGTEYSIISSITGIRDLYFKPDGLSFFVLGTVGASARIARYDLNTAWDLNSGITLFGTSAFFSETGSNYDSLFFNPNGLSVYCTNTNGDKVELRNLSTAWDITTLNPVVASFMTHAAQQTSPLSIYIEPTGNKLFLVGTGSRRIHQYNLGSPWGNTMTYSGKETDLSYSYKS
jgi:hypothetical protein